MRRFLLICGFLSALGMISSQVYSSTLYVCRGCVVEHTLAGVVAVSKENAKRFVALINDLYDAGFRGPVHCAAPYGTHVRHSRHYSGNACDFAQYEWGKTHAHIMYTKTAAAIIAKHGLTNGCSFRDCGHVGTDGWGHRYAHRQYHRYAHHYHHRHYARIG